MFLNSRYTLKKYFSRYHFSMLGTQTTFNFLFEDIKKHLPTAEFCAFDLEMTGIRPKEPEAISDLPQEKYYKTRSAANKYRIIQVGLCLFTRRSERELEARPYNIYVFPRERGTYSPQIILDASAADFNTRHGMNWNTWFSEGITYMPLKEAKKKREDLEKILAPEVQLEPTGEIKLNKEADIEKSIRLKTELDSWLRSESQDPFVINEQTKYFRKYVYEMLRKDYPELLYKSVQNPEKPSEKAIQIFKVNDNDEKKSFLLKKRQDMEEELLGQIGFTSLFELLADSKKKMVGHNCYLDLLFLYSHFVDYLPLSYKEFKTRLFELFPEVYDTKFIANTTRFKEKITTSSALDDLIALCNNKEEKDFADVQVKLAEGFEDYSLDIPNNARLHEAGYDAFVTGCCFAKMYYALERQEQERVHNAVNIVRSLSYFKNGALSGEEPMLNDWVIYFAKHTADNAKTNIEAIKSHIEQLEFKEFVRSSNVNLDTFNGVVLILDSTNEEHRTVFANKIAELKEKGINILTYQEYSSQKMVVEEQTNKTDAIEKTE